jgi:hypothetical protein
MEAYTHEQSHGAAARWERLRKLYADYEACPTCHTVAGNPCRNVSKTSWPSSTTLRSKPHPNRPKKKSDAQ